MKTIQHPLPTEVIERYLSILRTPLQNIDLSFLKRLIRAHLHTIPYENFSKFHYVQQFPVRKFYLPSTQEFLSRYEDQGWGGTCYPLNIHFSRLLQSLGYDCALVRVRKGHIAIQVNFSNRLYYVDVGYGCPLFQPIQLPLEGMMKFRKMGEEVYIRKRSDWTYEIDRHAEGRSFVQKEIDWKAIPLSHFIEDIRQSYLDTPENKVMRRLSATIFKPRYCYYLNNDTITRKNENTKEVSRFKNRNDWASKVYQIFGIDEAVALHAVHFLEERNVKFFE